VSLGERLAHDALDGKHGGLLDLGCRRRGLGRRRSDVPMVGHVAARDEHRLLHRDVSDGFLIQRSQKKDTLALRLRLNEIITAMEGASKRIVNVEDLSERELQSLKERYQELVDRVTAEQAARPV
jgi:Low affinity iron permease